MMAAAAGKVKLTVNGKTVEVPAGTTLLDACNSTGANVPSLCYHPRLPSTGVCRVCLVDVDQGNGWSKLVSSCTTPASNGMKVTTDSSKVKESVKWALSLMRANHPNSCMTCDANGRCEFQELLYRYDIQEPFPTKTVPKDNNYDDDSSPAIRRAMDKCVKCGRCVRMCQLVQNINVLGFENRGVAEVPSTLANQPLSFTQCIECGQCASVCPTGAITERSDVTRVLELMGSKRDKIVIAQTAPAVRVALGEEMNMAAGQATVGQMVAGLRRLGFDYVFDTDFSADLTIMEEGSELLDRLEKGGPFPMFTSCCPGWVSFVEKMYPEYCNNLSTARSPQQMMGSMIKSYFAKKLNVKAEDIVVVSVMPCTAKKFEATRPEFAKDGVKDVDIVLTTRELGHLMRLKKVPLGSLPPSDYDKPLGLSTGAAVIFGASGGVMEAAVRTAYEVSVGKPLPSLDLHDFRGFAGIKQTTAELVKKNGEKVKVRLAVCNGIANARLAIEKMKSGEAMWDFIEVMTCPGGCIGGGGQPKSLDPAAIRKRMETIYGLDAESPLRKSHENPAVAELYKDFLGKPLSHLSHDLLHTHYHARPCALTQQADACKH